MKYLNGGLVFFGVALSALFVFSCKKNNGPEDICANKQLCLISPKGGETFKVGNSVAVKWQAQNTISSVVVLITKDNWKTYIELTQGASIHRDSSFTWIVEEEHISSACKLRIRDYNDPTIRDETASTFIVEP